MNSRFWFINDEKLQKELDSIFDFIKYLIGINIISDTDTFYMINKTIVIYIGSIIESTLYYTLWIIRDKWDDKEKNIIDKKVRIEDKYKEEKSIYKINEFEDIVVCRKIQQFSWLDSKISFNSMIQAAKSGIDLKSVDLKIS